jgi:hypothetical protein
LALWCSTQSQGGYGWSYIRGSIDYNVSHMTIRRLWGAVMMYYLISLFSVLILLSIIIIGNRINKRLLQISKSIDGTNERLDRVLPTIQKLLRQYGFEESHD